MLSAKPSNDPLTQSGAQSFPLILNTNFEKVAASPITTVEYEREYMGKMTDQVDRVEKFLGKFEWKNQKELTPMPAKKIINLKTCLFKIYNYCVELFPDYKVCIAGGAVRDCMLMDQTPKDIDVFLFPKEPGARDVTVKKIKDQFKEQFPKGLSYNFDLDVNYKGSEVFAVPNIPVISKAFVIKHLDGNFFGENDEGDDSAEKTDDSPQNPFYKTFSEIPLQVMVRQHEDTPENMVNQFDWNICQLFIVDGRFHDWFRIEETAAASTLKLNKNYLNNMDQYRCQVSLRRGIDFANRYAGYRGVSTDISLAILARKLVELIEVKYNKNEEEWVPF